MKVSRLALGFILALAQLGGIGVLAAFTADDLAPLVYENRERIEYLESLHSDQMPPETGTPEPTATSTPEPPTETPSPEPTATPTVDPSDPPAQEPAEEVEPLDDMVNYMPLGVFERAAYLSHAVIKDLRAHNLDSYIANHGYTSSVDEDLGIADQYPGFNVYWRNTHQLKEWFNGDQDRTIENARSIVYPLVDAMNVDEHPSLKGHVVDDEPFLSEAEEVWLAEQAFRERDPDRPSFSMLLGNRIAGIHQPENDAVLMANIYPARANNDVCELTVQVGAGNWVDLADHMRFVASLTDADTAFWPLLQAHDFDSTHNDSADLRQPVVPELRTMQWLALGEGATGIFWFKLDSTAGMTGLVDSPELYAEVADLAGRARSIDDILLSAYKVEDQFVMGGNPSGVNPYASSLRARDGSADYVVAVNRSCSDQMLTLESTTLSGDLRDVETGEVFAQGEQIPFRAGDGRMFEVIPAEGEPEPTATPQPSATPEPTPTPHEPEGYSLMYALDPERNDPQPLDGATVSGEIYPFTLPEAGVDEVEFYLDGAHQQSEANPPFDFAGGNSTTASPWDTSQVAEGQHTITSELIMDDGSTTTISATFTVGGDEDKSEPAPEPTATPEPTPTPEPPGDLTPGGGSQGVPEVAVNYSIDVDEWWANHPLNPYQPNGIGIGDIAPPAGADAVTLNPGDSIQAAIDSAPSQGRVIYLNPGEYTYDFDIVDQDHIHVVGLTPPDASNPVVIRGGVKTTDSANNQSSQISACEEMKNLPSFAVSIGQYTRGNNGGSQVAAYKCYSDPVEDLYFKNLVFDGNGSANTLFMMRGVKDVVFDSVVVRNFADPGSRLIASVHMNIRASNVWFRDVDFLGRHRYPVIFDGVAGGGVVNSYIAPSFSGGGIGFFTNNDFSKDYNRNGRLDLDEQRISKYGVVYGTTIAEGSYPITLHAGQVLIANNTVTTTTNVFVRMHPRTASGNPDELYENVAYDFTGVKVLGNRLDGVGGNFMEVEGSSCSSPGEGNCPIIGQYEVWGNSAGNVKGNFIHETGSVVGPNIVEGNTYN